MMTCWHVRWWQVRKMVDGAYKRTLALLEEKRDLVTALALALLEKEARPRMPLPSAGLFTGAACACLCHTEIA